VPTLPKWTYTRPASTTGVGEPWLLKAWQKAGLGSSNTLTSWTTRPLSRSTPTANRSRPSSVAAVIQIWLPSITGDDHALPWMAVFQRTFWFSAQRVGG